MNKIMKMINVSLESGCKDEDIMMAIFSEIHRMVGMPMDLSTIHAIKEISISILERERK